jgi:5-methylcytosine-specific restriction endonuclease McrA
MAEQIISCTAAKAKGLSRYFTGEPCKHGHLEWRFVANRKCVACSLQAVQRWRDQNREEVRRKDRECYASDPVKSKAKNKKRDPEKLRQLARRNYRENIVLRKKKHSDWCSRGDNLERKRASSRNWYAENPDKALEHSRRRRARKLKAQGSHSLSDIAEILKQQRGRCAYCKSQMGIKYQIDHIVALSKGGSDDRRNIQLLCRPCNSKKHAKPPLEFARELGLLL